MTPPRLSLHLARRTVAVTLIAVAAAASCPSVAIHAQVPKRPAKAVTAAPAPVYFPTRFDWQTRSPSEAAMAPARVDEAVQFAIANENPASKDSPSIWPPRSARASRSTRRSGR